MPVVAYDLTETRRTAGQAALLVPDGDVNAFAGAVIRLARDPALRADLSLAARSRAAELTWDRSEPALASAYAALRDPGNGPARGRATQHRVG